MQNMISFVSYFISYNALVVEHLLLCYKFDECQNNKI